VQALGFVSLVLFVTLVLEAVSPFTIGNSSRTRAAVDDGFGTTAPIVGLPSARTTAQRHDVHDNRIVDAFR
jgi:hypothetical protein